MRADIHPDGTLRIKPESMTEQTALESWRASSEQLFDGEFRKSGLLIKQGALALLAFTPTDPPSGQTSVPRPYSMSDVDRYSFTNVRHGNRALGGAAYCLRTKDGKAFKGCTPIPDGGATEHELIESALADINRQAEAAFNEASGKIAT